MSLFNIDESLYKLAQYIYKSGHKREAHKILKLSNRGKEVVQVLEKVFSKDLGPFLSRERANNLAMAVLYYNPDKTSLDIEEYIHDGLLKTNESFYDAERRTKILSDRMAWMLSEKAVKELKKKKFLPQDMN